MNTQYTDLPIYPTSLLEYIQKEWEKTIPEPTSTKNYLREQSPQKYPTKLHLYWPRVKIQDFPGENDLDKISIQFRSLKKMTTDNDKSTMVSNGC